MYFLFFLSICSVFVKSNLTIDVAFYDLEHNVENVCSLRQMLIACGNLV